MIVLSRPDAQGFVLVAPMSHNHPEGTPTRSASRYGLPVDPIKGESRVNVGQPKVVHQENLRPNKPHTAMSYNHFAALKAEICASPFYNLCAFLQNMLTMMVHSFSQKLATSTTDLLIYSYYLTLSYALVSKHEAKTHLDSRSISYCGAGCLF